jgi:hypothetical protein
MLDGDFEMWGILEILRFLGACESKFKCSKCPNIPIMKEFGIPIMALGP